MLINVLKVGVKRRGPDSLQWCPATGQGATAQTNKEKDQGLSCKI